MTTTDDAVEARPTELQMPTSTSSRWANLVRYPWVLATLAIAALGGFAQLTPWHAYAWVLPAGYALLVAGRSAWRMIRELRRGTYGIDILAFTAIVASVAVAEAWAALVIVLMLTGGEALEDYASARARRDLTALLSHVPRVAHKVTSDGTTTDVPVDVIAPGDQVLVRPFEIVPVDGSLLTGSATFDESSLTGESLPVERTAGQEVLSGGVNGSTAVVLSTTHAARDSQYQQIITLVEDASASRAPIVRLADRVAIPFTVVALAIALGAWALSGDPARLAEVLVVATPCPLIIAAPVAFLAGTGRAARRGIIVKSSATLESLRRVRTIAFDKTGTLTRGAPSLVEVRAAGGLTDDQVLRLAASAEQYSSHVLAAAVIGAARSRELPLSGAETAQEVPAHGVTALVDGSSVVVGKRTYVADAVGVSLEGTTIGPGEMAVYVAIDRSYAGALVFSDEVRRETPHTLERLREHGVEHIVMLTGDDRLTADHVGQPLRIDDIRANCLPADKVDAVTNLPHRPVAMVGDGVNDAPALAAADIGIAMGARGSTAAGDSAHVVLLRDDISTVADAHTIARETVTVALQSIWVGMTLSAALMMIAAFGALPALIGAWLQEGVDVVAILWALRAGLAHPSTPREASARRP
ncbi:heavy metal translocating P-type ATPase [Ruania rhizosphaerae]|uniref:heavy metal translocating P-type ATPase n=1 Tax=Ruania rhizosphaerae TaxID=1840413 RepID=UPI001F305658|nr:heavy metal translocating P-type ATPase [Ruania rhizosphaerae]